MLSVYTRHSLPCTSDDISYKRAAARSGLMEFLGRTGAYFAEKFGDGSPTRFIANHFSESLLTIEFEQADLCRAGGAARRPVVET